MESDAPEYIVIGVGDRWTVMRCSDGRLAGSFVSVQDQEEAIESVPEVLAFTSEQEASLFLSRIETGAPFQRAWVHLTWLDSHG